MRCAHAALSNRSHSSLVPALRSRCSLLCSLRRCDARPCPGPVRCGGTAVRTTHRDRTTTAQCSAMRSDDVHSGWTTEPVAGQRGGVKPRAKTVSLPRSGLLVSSPRTAALPPVSVDCACVPLPHCSGLAVPPLRALGAGRPLRLRVRAESCELPSIGEGRQQRHRGQGRWADAAIASAAGTGRRTIARLGVGRAILAGPEPRGQTRTAASAQVAPPHSSLDRRSAIPQSCCPLSRTGGLASGGPTEWRALARTADTSAAALA